MARPVPPTPNIATTDRHVSPSPGVARRTGQGHVVSYGDGRICAARGCSTTLSRYNSTAYCAVRHFAAPVLPARSR